MKIALVTVLSEAGIGARRLCRAPGEIPSIVLTLAVGVGLVTAAWGLLESVLIRPLPYLHPEQLLRIWDASSSSEGKSISDQQFETLREAPDLPATVALYSPTNGEVDVPGQEGSRWVQGLRVSGDFFRVLGAAPRSGRAFDRQNETVEAAPAVVVSERLRIDRATPPEVGEQLRVNGVTYTVAGIMPSDFYFPDRKTEYWVPIVLMPRTDPSNPGSPSRIWHYPAIARRESSAAPEQLSAQMGALLSASGGGPSAVRALGLQDDMTAQVRAPLYMLQAAAVLTLLLAVGNGAWLFGWRVRRLRSTFQVMRAIGASPRRVLAAHLFDAGFVALLTTPAAAAIAYLLLRVALSQDRAVLPQAVTSELSTTSYALAVLAALVAALIAAAPSALSVLQLSADESLAIAPRAYRRRRVYEHGLMALQAGAVFAIATQATLMGLSLREMVGDHIGFGETDLVVARAAFPVGTPLDGRVLATRFEELVVSARSAGLPVAVANAMPLSGYHTSLNLRRPPNLEEDSSVGLRIVTSGYFDVVGLELLAGRAQSEDDTGRNRVVVNDVLAAVWFGGPDAAIDQQVVLGSMRNPPSQVVGVVRAVHHVGLLDSPEPEVYALYDDAVNYSVALTPNFFVIAPSQYGAEEVLRARIAAQLGDASVAEIREFRESLLAATGERPLITTGLAIFAGIGLALMFMGFHGMVGRTLAARRKETAIRVSLGASPQRVLVESSGTAAIIYGSGLAVGASLLWIVNGVAGAALFVPDGLHTPSVSSVGILAGALLAVVVGSACYRPVRRAIEADPVAALRSE